LDDLFEARQTHALDGPTPFDAIRRKKILITSFREPEQLTQKQAIIKAPKEITMNAKRWGRAKDLGKRTAWLVVATVTAALFAGCGGTTPELGGGGTVATGGAGGATAVNANSQLEKCSQSLGTLAVVEDQHAPWYRTLTQHKLGSTVPVLRMMIQQSNCFVVVERGQAMNNMMQERALQNSGEMRSGSSFQKGQIVAADYTMSPSITFSQKGTSGGGGGLGGFGAFGRAAGLVAGGFRANEAFTTLLMVDNRSGVQLAAAEGSAQNYDYNVLGAAFGSGWGSGGGGGAGGYTNTPEGKILVAAFMDSYNQIVRATPNYRAQEVKGGLGGPAVRLPCKADRPQRAITVLYRRRLCRLRMRNVDWRSLASIRVLWTASREGARQLHSGSFKGSGGSM
jgi:curli biogenesis system outer membrane secretion channel CsgG